MKKARILYARPSRCVKNYDCERIILELTITKRWSMTRNEYKQEKGTVVYAQYEDRS